MTLIVCVCIRVYTIYTYMCVYIIYIYYISFPWKDSYVLNVLLY